MAKKVIITVAQTGAFHGKNVNLNLPEQPHEIVASAYDCYNAGASIVHIHTRDKEGKSSCDTNTFAEINSGIRSKCNMIIQNSTAPATRPGSKADDGLAALALPPELLPDMCSLDCSLISTSWQDLTWIYEWTRPWLIKTAARMKELGIKPELECFNPVTVEEVFGVLKPAGVLNDPISLTFVMGMDKVSQASISYSEENLNFMIGKLPKNEFVNFSTLAIGANQLQGTVLTLLKGGNVRVGMEDNVYYRKGELAKSNAQLVERMVRIIRELDMEVATPAEAREILKLKKR
ncbi:3-keto-5-aminohexanoate cleavage protein [Papillibacter cinnamivorans]|uniref:3-keto-5-aminohexanoate cleavage enzyme n=1 Tax=Papillibacter cinnamivorans DSM 12816 TaxID=1122930 RepID=A0A1W1ZBE4_9FIRM|nr:3-keto-5-aminohexanoate cleavage protein [Papillibacter cinnamivorans]SMC45759.1 3-keto-5-aminohexanoate cleavage enzyme [Papillibacter cinnamivorans DSM 12816]